MNSCAIEYSKESLTRFAHNLVVLAKMAGVNVKLTENLSRDLEVVYFNQMDKGIQLNDVELTKVINQAVVQF